MLKERGAGIHRGAGERGIRGPEYVPGDAQEMGWEGLISDLFSSVRFSRKTEPMGVNRYGCIDAWIYTDTCCAVPRHSVMSDSL